MKLKILLIPVRTPRWLVIGNRSSGSSWGSFEGGNGHFWEGDQLSEGVVVIFEK
jgi:hypothetical protein